METSEPTRRLSAILMADVAGYSRLMGQDEDETIGRLKAYRQVFADLVGKTRGRIVNAPGDSILAEFASVQDAVTSAVEIQRELSERNAALPEDHRMHFRIGINLGEVVVEEDAIYGDGVNVAARLESLAEPGGICISGAVHANIQHKLPLSYEFIGRQEVKNIAQPIPTFRVLSQPGAAAHRVVRASRLAARLGERKGRIVGLAISAAVVAGLLVITLTFVSCQGGDQGKDQGDDRTELKIRLLAESEPRFSDGFLGVNLWGWNWNWADTSATLIQVYYRQISDLPQQYELDYPDDAHILITDPHAETAEDAKYYITLRIDADNDGEICPGDYWQDYEMSDLISFFSPSEDYIEIPMRVLQSDEICTTFRRPF